MYFDSNGDKVWERFINDDGIYNDISQYDPNDDRRDLMYQVIVDDDNNAIISGRNSNSAPIMKINQNGEVIWEKTLSADSGVVKYLDGNFIFMGMSQIHKIDSNGNILASTDYDMYVPGSNFDFTILSNGDIAVISDLGSGSGTDPDGYNYNNPKIVIFDGDLNHKNTIVLDSIHSDLYDGGIHFEQRAAGITETADGGLMIVGTYNKILNHNKRIFALKLSSDDSIEWEKTFGGDPNKRAPYWEERILSYSVTELPNQNLRIACEVRKNYSNDESFYFDLDSQGNRIF
jgi:hypothetical protein